jgi:ActR/RegA family two-component response regulator
MTDVAHLAPRRLVLVDDEVGRRYLARLLDSDPHVQVVGECAPADAVAVVHQEQPDAALVGLDRELHALEVLAPIRAHTPQCRLIVVTDLVDPWTLTEVLERGAHLLVDGDADLPYLGRILDQVDVDLAEEDAAPEAPPPVDDLVARRAAKDATQQSRLRNWLHASVAAAALVAVALGTARVGGVASVPAERAYQRVLIGS